MKLVKFEASWCQPCKTMDAILGNIELPIALEKIDIDTEEGRKAAVQYGIRGVPHMILFDENNKIVTRFGGVIPQETLKEQLFEHGVEVK